MGVYADGDALWVMFVTNIFGLVVQFIALNKLLKSQNVVPEEMYDKYMTEVFPREYTQFTENNDEFTIRVCRTILAQNADQISKTMSLDLQLFEVNESVAIAPASSDEDSDSAASA